MDTLPVGKRNPLQLGIRRSLLSLIQECPGLHFREIQRRTDTQTGQLTYHLDYIAKAGLISTISDGEYVRYYAPSSINKKERKILELLRRKSIRHIVLHLLSSNSSNNGQLTKKLGLSPSTVSWHTKKLIEEEVLEKKSVGRKSHLTIRDPEFIAKLLVKYGESFMDKLVDRFIDMWE